MVDHKNPLAGCSVCVFYFYYYTYIYNCYLFIYILSDRQICELLPISNIIIHIYIYIHFYI